MECIIHLMPKFNGMRLVAIMSHLGISSQAALTLNVCGAVKIEICLYIPL